ncbi:enoyl-ACP reductase FabI [Jeotgalicoccus meleagridis]|jgi:enoyl-[acyl-carrier protein] reductase I|uniref:Enoyl-[acyl-carrier-protein] reductase [NADH] n=1 Tax=Jeotgalicoccus meleagridis TaxID=2759181 RepID=A0A6V7RP24_9STAP|nr:enoyl-ACP reductase FabI [Jeotgalicoccus meleagridis]CAD2079845.1 Enoyl-[acyl-carrier-protein] reductase [NADPH] FabI [Jeotgalicoccus meleagridis]HIW37411.1 enoyl-ACP reductase FabI [Candidatus Jeotgalicoccus stercoravium]
MDLSGKTYVIMGVANKRSIAWGAARALDKMGAKLVFTILGERFRKELDKLLQELEGDHDLIVECDVSSDESVENAFKEIGEKTGGVDGVMHAIAFANKDELKGGISDTTREGFKVALDISAYSLLSVAKHSKAILNEGGSLVTMTYLGGERAMPNYNVMGVAKAALDANVRYLAYDLGESGFRVNAVSAGPIRTLSSSAVGEFKTILKEIEQRAPLRRNVDQLEVGNTVAFLLSDLASGITGEVVHVDSGYHIMA